MVIQSWNVDYNQTSGVQMSISTLGTIFIEVMIKAHNNFSYELISKSVNYQPLLGLIPVLCPANKRRCYFVMTSLIGLVQA